MLKDMDKKRKMIFVSLICLPLLLILFLIMIKGCSNSKVSYDKYEKMMVKSAEKYFDKKSMLPETEGGSVSVDLDTLIKSNKLKTPEKALKDETCEGSVTVTNNGGLYLYNPYLKCDNYTTVYLIDKLLNDVVIEKSGLYDYGDEFVFKGDKTNNYVSFFGKKYLIISIDKNNVMKLLKLESEKDKYAWDDKFNSDRNRFFGKNNYSDSLMIDTLNNIYASIDDKRKKYLVATDVCAGNRSSEYDKVDKVSECSKILNNQFISLMNVYDFPRASYDPECTSIYSGSCSNYNYIFDNIDYSWLVNGISDNTYETFYYSNSIDFDKSSSRKKINIVIYVSSNLKYSKGSGSFDDPYVIE